MRFSSAIGLAVVVALASSISATPMNANLQHCEALCLVPLCFGYVSRISVFIVVQYDRWH
ncbi:hypothetical protein EDD22DRAFT_920543, partial [Suillus occidentalis]